MQRTYKYNGYEKNLFISSIPIFLLGIVLFALIDYHILFPIIGSIMGLMGFLFFLMYNNSTGFIEFDEKGINRYSKFIFEKMRKIKWSDISNAKLTMGLSNIVIWTETNKRIHFGSVKKEFLSFSYDLIETLGQRVPRTNLDSSIKNILEMSQEERKSLFTPNETSNSRSIVKGLIGISIALLPFILIFPEIFLAIHFLNDAPFYSNNRQLLAPIFIIALLYINKKTLTLIFRRMRTNKPLHPT